MKKLKYLVCDTETATMPFADEIALNSEQKKKIAIARPLVYDIGWVIVDRKGNIIKKANYLIQETFFVPSIFNTAYYKEKRPIYMKLLKDGAITTKLWNDIMYEFITDCDSVDYVGAYNSMFDFDKAIPFTDLYISKLYSDDYTKWEEIQYKLCEKIAKEPYKRPLDKEFDNMNFNFRKKKYPLFDLWGMAVNNLINTKAYRKSCLDNKMLTESGEFFKTSAESSYRYVKKHFGFDEAHTALADAEIEAELLVKILKRKAITQGIEYFPFRNLGYTDDFLYEQHRKGKVKAEHIETVIEVMNAKIPCYDELNTYRRKLEKKVRDLEILLMIVREEEAKKKKRER